MGELGAEGAVHSVKVHRRSLGENDAVLKQKTSLQRLRAEKWTPFLMMLTLFNRSNR